MQHTHSTSRPIIQDFLIWLIISSIPFWVLGAVISTEDLPINLPISALMAFNPMIIAIFLTFRASGRAEAIALLKRTLDMKRIPSALWYIFILLFMPIASLLAYGLMVMLNYDMPDPYVPILIIPLFFILFFITATGEELGWSGYVFEPMQRRWGTLSTGFLIGIIWAVWHIIPYIQTGNNATWIFWQCVVTILLRVIIVWIFTNTQQSVFGAILFHTMINVTAFVFPNYGSYYDPFIVSIVLVPLVIWIMMKQSSAH
mgnify:CR=1 FL=1